ncbi:hypothetical protein NUW58_g8488 [Xylaria curta]|uniref:Uncharacterized protein n=1 Tax=Xylaria curta TaxID=42375 RepID=A0ACC1N950_9PEZI|nr:hypothetical protein NUW58_g8488 [Xylaria curta]
MSRALFFLIENLLWDYAESRLSKKSIERYRPFPLPSEEERVYNSSDVSIIVPTVGFDPQSFSRALISWLANQPAEIIVVTVGRDYPQAKALLNSDAIQEANKGTEITLLSIIRPNKRRQLIEGVSASTGRIVAFVDDDAFWNPDTLLNLLAPFQVPDIGLVGGPIESYLPEDRQNPAVITAYEVALLRRQNADGWADEARVRTLMTDATKSATASSRLASRSKWFSFPAYAMSFTIAARSRTARSE